MNDAITRAYRESKHRLLLLDYDGTLVEYFSTPGEAKPSAEVIGLLRDLASDAKNTVAVVSGRDQHTLEAWLGDLPITLVAEHGAFVHQPGGEWAATLVEHDEWKPVVRRILEKYDIEGSIVEEKEAAMAWHYRLSYQVEARHAATRLLDELLTVSPQLGLRVIEGNMLVEVTRLGADKGHAARRLLEGQDYDFVLAAGDDTTDEDMFKVMPESAMVIKVGDPSPHAQINLLWPKSLRELLSQLAQSRVI